MSGYISTYDSINTAMVVLFVNLIIAYGFIVMSRHTLEALSVLIYGYVNEQKKENRSKSGCFFKITTFGLWFFSFEFLSWNCGLCVDVSEQLYIAFSSHSNKCFMLAAFWTAKLHLKGHFFCQWTKKTQSNNYTEFKFSMQEFFMIVLEVRFHLPQKMF